MKLKKRDINEIIDGDNSLIGSDNTPKSGVDLESQASNTTDYNVVKSRQPFRYDMLGRFGFTLLPFFESEGGGDDVISTELNEVLGDLFIDILSHYIKNPNKIKSDYRRLVKDSGNTEFITNLINEYNNKIIGVIKPHIENSLKTLDENISNEINEGEIVNKDKKDNLSKKKSNKEILDKDIKRVAGLLNKKMDKDAINKLVNILEKE